MNRRLKALTIQTGLIWSTAKNGDGICVFRNNRSASERVEFVDQLGDYMSVCERFLSG